MKEAILLPTAYDLYGQVLKCRKANVGASTSGNYTYYNNYPPLNNGQFDSLFLNSYKATTFVEPKTFLCDGGTGHLDIYSKLIDENKI